MRQMGNLIRFPGLTAVISHANTDTLFRVFETVCRVLPYHLRAAE
jgi:hypothetical protein